MCFGVRVNLQPRIARNKHTVKSNAATAASMLTVLFLPSLSLIFIFFIFVLLRTAALTTKNIRKQAMVRGQARGRAGCWARPVRSSGVQAVRRRGCESIVRRARYLSYCDAKTISPTPRINNTCHEHDIFGDTALQQDRYLTTTFSLSPSPAIIKFQNASTNATFPTENCMFVFYSFNIARVFRRT